MFASSKSDVPGGVGVPNAKIKTDMKINIDLAHSVDENGKRGLTLNSVVEQVVDEHTLIIQMPIYKMAYYPLYYKEEFMIQFTTEHSVFSVPARFLGKLKRGGLTFAKVELIGPVRSGQKREFYRLPCSIPTMLGRVNEDGDVAYSKCSSQNISCGGMLLLTNEAVVPNEIIKLKFDIGTVETAYAKVIRMESSRGKVYKYKCSANFIDLSYEQERKLNKFITAKLLERKGRIGISRTD